MRQWKRYLESKGLYSGETITDEMNDALKRGMQTLEAMISKRVPSVEGMIWSNGKINSQASIDDIEEALSLLDKVPPLKSEGVANFDALGPPGKDQISTIFNQMFISQEDSKLDEWTPEGNQNQGKFQNDAPKESNVEKKKIIETKHLEEPKQQKKPSNIDQRMKEITRLMDEIKI